MNEWTEAETRAEHARKLYDQGRLPEAAAELRAAIEVNPYNASWHFNLALTLEALEDYTRACEAYRAALAIEPDDVETLNCLGVNMNRLGRYAEALAHFERIEKLDPTYEPCYCNRIISYTEMSQHDKAELMFYMARLFKDDCPLCCYNLGSSFHNIAQYDRAIDCWQQTLRLDPAHPQANARIADAYWYKGDLPAACRYYQAELDLYGDDADTHVDYGELLMTMGRLDEAGKQFRAAVEIDPRHAGAQYRLGELALRRGQLNAAQRRFQEVLRLEPKYPGAHAKLGQIMLRRNRHARAARHFLAELKRCGDDTQTLNELGQLLLEAHQVEHANAVLRRLVALEPHDAHAQHNLAVSYFLMNKLDEGIRHCRRAIKAKPDYPLALYNLSLAHYRKGEHERARRYVTKALALAPEHRDVQALSRRLGMRTFWQRARDLLRHYLSRRRGR